MNLRKDLDSLLGGISGEHGFVSLESLKGCMIEQKVKEHIDSIGIPTDSRLLEAIFKRPRLFAFLVLIGCEKAVAALIIDIEDDTFFLAEKDVPSDFGDSDQRAKFFRLQSRLPPMLTCKDPPQEFPDSFRPPFSFIDHHSQSGTYGVVHQVKIAPGHLTKHSNDLFAWKRVEFREQDEYQEYQREVKTMQARRHEHLLPLVACYSTPNGQSFQSLDSALHFVFPWAVTNMFDWMRSRTTPTEHYQGLEDPRRRKEYLYDTIMSLVSAVSYLHREIDGAFTSHHDLKPQNILLLGERWTISDFGMTRLRSLGRGSQTERKLGSYPYQPPEYGEKDVRKHGRSFDIWSLGCIIVELAVLIVYGWESKKLDAFETERSKNRNRPRVSGKADDVSFHNNTSVVYRWIRALASKDGSRNFKYLMITAAKMLSIDRDARPYSWDVEICLYEQFHPDAPGQERREKMRDLVQAPVETSRYNPLVRAIAEDDEDWVQCLQKNGWTLASSSSTQGSITDPKDNFGTP